MIAESAAAAMEACGYAGGVRLEVSVRAALRSPAEPSTGGWVSKAGSPFGTTGIVEPMSEAALVDTIRLLIDRRSASDGEKILICPGNYGQEYCRRELGIDLDRAVKFSNFIGDTLDYLVYKGFRQALLVGHMGKLVKLAGGIMNTHSSVADCRMEILAAHSAMAGAGAENVRRLMACRTTEEAMALIRTLGLDGSVWESLMERIRFHVNYRTGGLLQTEIILFESGGSRP
jgi:cobalt-precorrin-5B (C1)-methyltransferase